MVAQLRGAKFKVDGKTGMLIPVNFLEADEGIIDVVLWLGFADTQTYLKCLAREREKIFRRAPEDPT